MTTPSVLAYVKRSTCQLHLDPINLTPADTSDGRERVVKVGQSELCTDCNRWWTAVQFISFGGIVQTQWVCTRPPGVPDPMDAVNARLAALEASNTSLGGTAAAQAAQITAQAAQITALTTRVATLEAKTVTERIARSPITAAVLAVGGTANFAVTWTTAFPDTNYTPDVSVPTALIGKVAWSVKAGTKTAAGLTITLTATAAVTLSVGTDLIVTAVCYA